MKLSGWLFASAVALQVLNTEAQTYTLTDGNSSVSLTPGSSIGMNNWTVDGQNQLNQQWFYYSVGSASVAAPISSLALATPVQPSGSLLNTTYTGAGFSLQAVYSLVGGALGSGTSDLGEQIKIQNTSAAPLTFHFFQYADF
ncbi:MAG: dystroglycan-type cadherin-like domain repeat protein, partial [Pedosphaera sp.]|nr:dystroglycan-type cadherin-like domain repeat protein [Pedosphaera sp.]